jgi:hypothetical protein
MIINNEMKNIIITLDCFTLRVRNDEQTQRQRVIANVSEAIQRSEEVKVKR